MPRARVEIRRSCPVRSRAGACRVVSSSSGSASRPGQGPGAFGAFPQNTGCEAGVKPGSDTYCRDALKSTHPLAPRGNLEAGVQLLAWLFFFFGRWEETGEPRTSSGGRRSCEAATLPTTSACNYVAGKHVTPGSICS